MGELTLEQKQALAKAAARLRLKKNPGYSSTDPNRTEADFWHDVQDDVVKQHPIAARAATALQGVPFVGQYADEVVGYFSPEAGRAMRVSQEAMADTRPGQTAALQIGGAVAGSIPLAAAAGPTAIAAMPQSLAGRALVGAGIGAAAGGLEGAVSGYGAGNDGNRAQAAQDYGVAGAAMGGAMGAAAPMAAAGLRAFVRIAQAWQLSVDEQLSLLGQPPRSTFFAWRKHPDRAQLPRDTLERLSCLLGIYKALQILLPDPTAADAWVRKPNTAAPFGGRSALAHMLGGNVADLYVVRRYLDGVRGGGWS